MATPVQIAPNGQHSVFVFPKNGAETAVPDATLISQLLHAASRGNLHMLGNLLEKHAAEGLTASSCDYDKRTALHLAASEGLVEVAKFLVERPDCDVNTKDRWQGTPLDDAVRHRHSELVDFLVARGAVTGDDNKVTQDFMAAVEANDIETVANLLRSGASPSAADYDQRSVLHIAVSKGNERIIRLLVEAGGDLNAKDTFGLTPLDEAARRGTRTGENKIRDLLLSLGASKPGADVPTEGSSRLFVWTSWVVQLIFLVLFAAVTDFGVGTASESSARMGSVYSMFVDVHVMIVVGFGFLMTFLRKYGYSSVGFNLLIATMVIQWHILCGGFVHQLFAAVTTQGGYVWHKIHISVTSLLLADFAAAAVLITFGALLGKVTPLQLYVVGLCEILFFAVNENIIVGSIGIVDVGGSVIVHVFGAYFGLAASKVLTPLRVMDDGNNGANYHSDLFAMIGTAFLWIYWPSFVAAPAGEADRELAVISTLLSLTGSCIAAFQVSHLMRERQFCMVDVQNATLAGGVAIGSIANLAIQSPAIAIATGAASGALSVVGYTRVQPWLQRVLSLHDTCGVNNLHGMPGLLSGLLSIAFAATAQESTFPTRAQFTAAYGPRFADGIEVRSSGQQALAQFLGLITSFSIAITTGAVTGALAKLAGKLESRPESYFVDSAAWEVPELETPFYFDRRGEINRDLLKDLQAKAEARSVHGGRAWSEHGSEQTQTSAQVGTKVA